MVFDNNRIPVLCDNWQFTNGQWKEWYSYWTSLPGYPILWVNGVSDADLACPDRDNDQVFDWSDNCPCNYNPTQADADGDKIGDACENCCTGITGNVDGDPEGRVNLSDVTTLIGYVYLVGKPICCRATANTNGDIAGKVNLSDIVTLINYVYVTHTGLAACR